MRKVLCGDSVMLLGVQTAEEQLMGKPKFLMVNSYTARPGL